MSFYINSDDDPLYKNEVELVCGLCTTRFKKFKVDLKNLSYFDETPIEMHCKKGSLGGSSCCKGGEICSTCNEDKSKLDLLDQPYKCSICDKLFAHSLHLLKHKRRHTDQESGRDVVEEEVPSKYKSKLDPADRPYKCPICDLSFAHSIHLLKHQLRHTDQESGRDVAEEEVCISCSEDESKLNLSDRPYKCTSCDKLFAHSLHLLKHQRSHTDQESDREVAEEEYNLEQMSMDPIS